MAVRWLVVLNPKAGAAAKASEAGEDLGARVVRACAAHGIEARVISPKPGGLDGAVREAAGGVDAVVAAGGDGTVTAVARAVHRAGGVGGGNGGAGGGCGGVLGVLPLGTFNHLGRELGVPVGEEVEAMVAALATRGRVVERTVGVLRDASGEARLFVNFASVGVHPEMVRERDTRLKRAGGVKRWYGKWPAMLAAGVKVLLKFRVRRLEVSAETPEGDTRAGVVRTPAVFVGVNRWLLREMGVGVPDRPGPVLLVAHAGTRLGALALLIKAGLGLLRPGPSFTVLEADHARLDANRTLRIALDGELETARPPLHFTAAATPLRVLRVPGDGP